MKPVISVEHLSKSYRLGQINTGTFTNDLKLWWAKARGKPNPFLRIGDVDHGNRDGEILWALRDVNFTVEQGEVLGIIGRNGAGKSTLLKILSRVTAPTEGRIRAKGRVASLLEVGTGFHPDLTGRENIYLNGAILGMSRAEVARKFDEIVDFAEVEKFIDTPVKRYSSGMYVRLAFAVAAHLDAEIMIVDEVLAVGDAEFQKKCLGKMGDVAQGGRTVLFVSHNMAAIQVLCPYTLMFSNGCIQFMGATADAVSYYLKNKNEDNNDVLKDRTVHPQNLQAYFTSLQLNSDRDENISTVMTGQSLTIDLGFTTKTREKNLDFSIGFYDAFGEKILHFSSLYANKNFQNFSTTGIVSCQIPHLPLPEGKYSLSIALYVDNKIIDRIPNVKNIYVHTGDFYGTGRIPAPQEQKIFLDHHWDLL